VEVFRNRAILRKLHGIEPKAAPLDLSGDSTRPYPDSATP